LSTQSPGNRQGRLQGRKARVTEKEEGKRVVQPVARKPARKAAREKG